MHLIKNKIVSSVIAGLVAVSFAPGLALGVAFASHGEGHGHGRGNPHNNWSGNSSGSAQVVTAESQNSGNNDSQGNGPGLGLGHSIGQGNIRKQSDDDKSGNSSFEDEGNENSGNTENGSGSDNDVDNLLQNPSATQNPTVIQNLISQLQAIIAELEARLQALTGQPQAQLPAISNVAVSNISTSTATATWTTNVPATSKVFFSTASPVDMNTASVAADASLAANHSLALTGLSANTAYFFVVQSADTSGNTVTSAQSSFTTAQIAPPVISAVAVTGISTSTAMVSWTTDIPATSKIYFSAVSPVNLTSASTTSDGGLVTSHSIALTSLHASTTYFFVVESANPAETSGAPDVARTSQMSFATAALPAPARPSITSVMTTNVSSTSATVTWQTNELASSRVFYATSSAVNTATAASVSDATPATMHALNLTELTASSTYFFVVQSADASGNTTTSPQFGFTTLP